ncbi:MAG: hypothetical protein ACR5KW_02720 [Wolbachia sp.]
MQEYTISKENSWIKETKMNENNQAKQLVQKQNIAARSIKELGNVLWTSGVEFCFKSLIKNLLISIQGV